MSKVEVAEHPEVYHTVNIVLETREEFLMMLDILNRGGGRTYNLWKQLDNVAETEGIKEGR
ncbi:hypothetical protein LCGC14_2991260 [marine sediment metagenome]|uniref:Uncharacterized protein n=1 Tax=marine sediment metagenome TaxID=412755 RepID=A0A0F8ZB97_9ZZZZ